MNTCPVHVTVTDYRGNPYQMYIPRYLVSGIAPPSVPGNLRESEA
jgi:hypothetical protein